MNKRPAYIFFDYGNTLVFEHSYNPLAGISVLWEYVCSNPNNITPSQFAIILEKFDKKLGRYNSDNTIDNLYEFHEYDVFRILFEYYQIKLNISYEETEYLYWKTAFGGEPTKGIYELLFYLQINKISSAVISNTTYSSSILQRRVNEILPYNSFKFCMSSSDYIFRKPDSMLFNVALAKAGILAEDAWFVGDTALMDVDGAVNAGMTGVWYRNNLIYREKPKCKDYINIASWYELIDIIENLD